MEAPGDDLEPEPVQPPDDHPRESPVRRRGSRVLVYFGLRQDDGSPVPYRGRPSVRWIASYSVIWALIFPLFGRHRHGYVTDVLILAPVMFVIQLAIYTWVDWRRRRRAAR